METVGLVLGAIVCAVAPFPSETIERVFHGCIDHPDVSHDCEQHDSDRVARHRGRLLSDCRGRACDFARAVAWRATAFGQNLITAAEQPPGCLLFLALWASTIGAPLEESSTTIGPG